MSMQSLTSELHSALEAAVVPANSWFPSARELEQILQVRAFLPSARQTVTFTDAPHKFSVNWRAVTGATKVEVDAGGAHSSATDPAPNFARIGISGVRLPLEDLQVSNSGSHRIITNPASQSGSTRFVSLRLQNLRHDGDEDKELKSESDLSGGLRIVLSTKMPNGEWVPLYTVPRIAADGVMPAMFSGATYEERVLRFPAVQAQELRLSLVTGSRPENFSVQTILLDGASGTEEVLPLDLELRGPDGRVQWAFPGQMPAGTAAHHVDLRNAIQLALNADLPAATNEKRALEAQFSLTAKSGSSAAFSFGQPRGAILREHKGMQRFELKGEEISLALGETLDGQTPDTVSADLAVKYLGMKVLAAQSDFALEPGEEIQGKVVEQENVLRIMEEGALAGRDLAKIGIIGRAPVDSQLDIQLFKYQGGQATAALGMPARLMLTADETVKVYWVDMPAIEDWSGSVALGVRALSGRFLWAERARPLARFVVREPDPGGEILYLRNRGVTNNQFGISINAAQQSWRAQHFTSQAFRQAMPQLYSDLFLTVDFTDLTLRYRR